MLQHSIWIMAALCWTSPSYSAVFPHEKTLLEFSQTHQLAFDTVQIMLADARFNPQVLHAIQTPWEHKPWFAYYPIFINKKRLAKAAAFANKHQSLLRRAQHQFGVPAEIILAILSVETDLGRHMGAYPVLDALYTLAFFYPKRGLFFQQQLAHYLRLHSEQHWPLRWARGSYAGAMGMAQFIPSSYRQFAVDFSSPLDHKINLFDSIDDAVGSIANYLHHHGWQARQPVAQSMPSSHLHTYAWVPYRQPIPLPSALFRQHRLFASLENQLHPPHMLRLREKLTDQYWLVFHNFKVLQTYNTSPLYALTIHLFSQHLSSRKLFDTQN